ncbi:hypothetical protein [uncultured Anaerofustis sp.]|nr:hypothetical protein [uncultured Anaerofustis sp.]
MFYELLKDDGVKAAVRLDGHSFTKNKNYDNIGHNINNGRIL